MCGFIVVDKSKACATSTTVECFETKCHDTRLVCLVQCRNLFRQISLGNIWSRRVEDIHDHLAPLQQAIGNEFASAEGYWCIRLHETKSASGSSKMSSSHPSCDQSLNAPNPLIHRPRHNELSVRLTMINDFAWLELNGLVTAGVSFERDRSFAVGVSTTIFPYSFN